MESIYDTNEPFDFSKLVLAKPTSISGGNYFIRFLIGSAYLYIQSPKCLTKQGIQKNAKKYYTDLMFSNENENFIQWMENLENHCQQGIFKNREQWLDGDMDLHDIENYFTPILKIYKSGKYYSIRANINSTLGKPAIKIYDEDENDVNIESINDKTNLMTILEIKGIKCSPRSFQIEVELKQMMVLKPDELFSKYLLKPKNRVTDEHLVNIDTPIVVKKNDDLESIVEKTPNEIPDSIFSQNETEIDNEVVDESDTEPLPELVVRTEEPDEKGYIKESVIDGIQEIDFHLDELPNTDVVHLKQRNDVYYQLYKEARKKAKIAREFALSSYLEAKEIKNKYMLDDIKDSDESDIEFDEDESTNK